MILDIYQGSDVVVGGNKEYGAEASQAASVCWKLRL
jgi:hypothetical protein